MSKKQYLFDYIIERPRLSTIVGVLLIFTGFLVSDLPKMVSTLTWSETSGTIILNQTQKIKIKEYGGDFYEETHVYIRYEYVVDGTRYETNSLNTQNLPFYPPEVALQYPVDKIVAVYYNPSDPAEAVLEPGFVDVFKAFDVFSFIFFAAGIYFIRAGILKRKENEFWKTYQRQH